jgi:hypothetical protein
MSKVVGVAIVAMVALAGCGGSTNNAESGSPSGAEESGAPTNACPSLPPALSSTPKLPPNFPSPSLAVYTATSKAGPSTIVNVTFKDDLPGAYDAYKSAFQAAAGYTLTKAEHDPRDAELDWSGGNTTGEVKMDWPCLGQTGIDITIRPA